MIVKAVQWVNKNKVKVGRICCKGRFWTWSEKWRSDGWWEWRWRQRWVDKWVRWIQTRGFGTCVEQPGAVCQECTVADDVPSRAEDCIFSGRRLTVTIGDRDCTAQYNCCLPATTDCRRFCRFVCFYFLFNFVRCPCNVSDVIVSP